MAGGLLAVLAIVAIVVFRPSGEWTGDAAPPASVGPDHWTTGDKDAIGTAASRQSNVWFTAAHGTLADVLYPTVDADNLRQLGFLVTDGSSFLFDAATQGVASSTVADDRALTYRLQVDDPQRRFSLITTMATDPARPVVVLSSQLIGQAANLSVYAYLVPHLRGSGAAQTAFFDGSRGYVSKQGMWLAVAGDMRVGDRTAGYLGRGDGLDQLHHDALTNRYRQAGPGGVTLTWKVHTGVGSWITELALGTSRAQADGALDATAKSGAQSVFDAYRSGWRAYASSLTPPANAQPLFFYSAEVIKMAEDKIHAGAIVASLARPWGDTAPDNDGDVGYRKVWPRDLYHAASGMLAAGDSATAYDVLRFMGMQQRTDGSMPQNTDLNGTPVWTGQQLDETADAILLGVRLAGKATGPDIARAADYIVHNGPATQQERWEEASGYSPATIAAEIAALKAAAAWGERNGLAARAVAWLDTAARWDASLESWTLVHAGAAGVDYYLRISPDGKPNTAEPINLANGGGLWDQREIVDPSFLELVRLGVRPASDPRITSTLRAIDNVSFGSARGVKLWYRYPHDGYGEKNEGSAPPGQGHLWPLLTGERGVYTMLGGGDARPYLDELQILAGSDQLLGEQVWEDTGLPTGSARPLVWAHAEYIILAKAVSTGAVDDRPAQ
ncbi:MAG TPA: glycoside hydrolase family 15 protein [Candidatus Limnocylindrales bacterium]|nr:glycoside hydrolase family 15 protein [Candidatus Limnocylindrales bacterium]